MLINTFSAHFQPNFSPLCFWRFPCLTPQNLLLSLFNRASAQFQLYFSPISARFQPTASSTQLRLNFNSTWALSAYKMDVRDYFGSQKTLVFSGKREIIPTGWVQLKDKKDELRRCCHSYSATWPPAPSTLPVEPPLIGLQMSSMVSTRTRLR